MRSSRRKRGRSDSHSPPLQPAYAAVGSGGGATDAAHAAQSGSDIVLSSSCGLIHYEHVLAGGSSSSGGGGGGVGSAAAAAAFTMRQNLVHMEALQSLLRRTSLAEMRDREVVDWLLGTDQWLRELDRPLTAGSSSSGGGARGGEGVSASPYTTTSRRAAGDALTSAYRSSLSELRLLVLGVLNTMPWWRVVETVAGHGGEAAAAAAAAAPAAARRTSEMDRAAAARHAITRWTVRLQVAFERVCLRLIDQSQQTVRGVLEALLMPCRLRPPVHDGARRSIPSDSFIRVLNAVASKYSPAYVVELLEGCTADLMPRRRWVERRHHVACTAVLLYIALEGHTPAYRPHLGNSQSLQRAVGILKSLRSRGGGSGGSPWMLPPTTRSSSLTLPGGTSEESGTDVGDASSPTSTSQHRYGDSLASMLPTHGVLPSGYVSAAMREGARVGGAALRVPVLPRPSPLGRSASLTDLATTTTTTATNTPSETELSDSAGVVVRGGGSDSSTAAAATAVLLPGRSRARPASGVEAAHRLAGGDGDAGAAAGAASAPSLFDVSVAHNNKLLAYRNDIVRVLLNRLLEVEMALEPLDAAELMPSEGSRAGVAHWLGGGGGPSAASRRCSVRDSPVGSSGTSAMDSPVATAGGGGRDAARAFPHAPLPAAAVARDDVAGVATAASSALSSPAAVSPASLPFQRSGSLSFSGGAGPAMGWDGAPSATSLLSPPLERCFNAVSQPYLRILRDCATLVYGRLADDMRRQQVAGSCGNADWWAEILFFYVTLLTRVDRPVYLLYLAPSLSMLGTGDEPVGLLHKLITLVTKGGIPVEQPRSSVFGRTTGAWPPSSASSALSAAPVQPVRLRMAPPTGASRRVLTMEERLRAAHHIFPLFRFLQDHIDETSGEGVRRRLLKWTAQELRRLRVGSALDSVGSSSVVVGAGGGAAVYSRSRPAPPSREARLTLVAFAQCAAMSEVMGVEVVPPLNRAAAPAPCTGKSARDSARFTSSTASGDTSGDIAAALEPLLRRYTLQSEPPPADDDDEEEEEERDVDDSSASGAEARECSRRSSTSDASAVANNTASPPRRHIDLRQMEYEGLLKPQLMANCPWQAWLR
ncbi:hypothetical protein NESM_000528800 [Novymonas esmeraldas]|uniref:Uncharacterized protein n=1 Tax=Novymonas esmeraldas TaxID=1808958 RepID=A0AAW0ES27_9TRYP